MSLGDTTLRMQLLVCSGFTWSATGICGRASVVRAAFDPPTHHISCVLMRSSYTVCEHPL